MSNLNNPALYWRETIISLIEQMELKKPDNPVEYYKQYAEKDFEEARESLSQQLKHSESNDQIEMDRSGVYLSGILLLTYGRLDVVPEIINNRKRGRHPQWVLIRSVEQIIPLPAHLDLFSDPQSTINWIENHQDRLQWNETEGRFKMNAVLTAESVNRCEQETKIFKEERPQWKILAKLFPTQTGKKP